MDPNLEKIRDHNRHLIRTGQLSKPIHQAQDYLEYILGYDFDKVNTELDSFVASIKKLRRRRGGQRQEKQG